MFSIQLLKIVYYYICLFFYVFAFVALSYQSTTSNDNFKSLGDNSHRIDTRVCRARFKLQILSLVA